MRKTTATALLRPNADADAHVGAESTAEWQATAVPTMSGLLVGSVIGIIVMGKRPLIGFLVGGGVGFALGMGIDYAMYRGVFPSF